jgi:hypothetical protein
MKESVIAFLKTDKGFVLLWIVLIIGLNMALGSISTAMYQQMTGDYSYTYDELFSYQVIVAFGSNFIMALAQERAIRFYTGKHIRNWITVVTIGGLGLYFARVTLLDWVIKSDLTINFSIMHGVTSSTIIFITLAQWFLLRKDFEKAWLWLVAGLCGYGLNLAAMLQIPTLILSLLATFGFALALVFMKRATEPESEVKNEPIVEARN